MFAFALTVASAFGCARGKCTEDVSLLQLRARSVDSIFDELEQEAIANVSTLLPDVSARDEREHRRNFKRFCRHHDCSDPATARKVFEGSDPVDNERDAREFEQDGVRVGENAIVKGLSKWDVERELLGLDMELDEVDEKEEFYLDEVDDADTQPEMRLRAGGLRSSGEDDEDLPDEFDPRKKWPECAHVISAIRSQKVNGKGCGNCWANGGVGAFNDRVCIASQGRFSKLLSVQHASSCCPPSEITKWSHYRGETRTFTHPCKGVWKNGNGCGGGGTRGVWKMAENEGIVTGGLYTSRGSGSTCWPNPLPTKPPECPAAMAKGNTGGSTSTRPYGCFEGRYSVDFDDDRHMAIPGTLHMFPHDGTNGEGFWRRRSRAFFKWDKGKRDNTNYVPAIKRELMTHGSFAISMLAGCFGMNYKGGVVKCRRDCGGAGHAMRVIGWGREDSKQYWLIANSWGTDWGEEGFLRVEIGCGYVGNFDASFVAPDAGRNRTSEPDEPTKQPTMAPTPAPTVVGTLTMVLNKDNARCKGNGKFLEKGGTAESCKQKCLESATCKFAVFKDHAKKKNTNCHSYEQCRTKLNSKFKVYKKI